MIRICLLAAFGLWGCSSPKPIVECDAMLDRIDRLSHCKALPATDLAHLGAAANRVRAMLQQLDRSGGVANTPKDLAAFLRDSCGTQDAAIHHTYIALGCSE